MKWISSLLLLGLVCSASAEDVLFETSFEKDRRGASRSADKSASVLWASKGCKVSSSVVNEGKQSLQLKGGEQVLHFRFNEGAQQAKGVSFWALRGSKNGSLSFEVEIDADGELVQLGQYKNAVEWDEEIDSTISLEFPEAKKITGMRFKVNSESRDGVFIDDFALLSEAPYDVTEQSVDRIIPKKKIKLLSSKHVFKAGDKNTHTYRIPSIITAANGDLIAACDARRDNAGDLVHFGSRNIDIVVKRSTNNGKTWGRMITVADYPNKTGGTDPSMVLDRDTGRIYLFYSYIGKPPSKQFFFRYHTSDDHGKTWSEYRDITDDITTPDMAQKFKFISSGRAFQKEDGTLIHNYVVLGAGIRLFESKDQGKTWSMQHTSVAPADESRVIELTDGRMMVNSRVSKGSRYVHVSDKEGKNWTTKEEIQLPDPRCNGAIIRYTSKKHGYAKDRLLFCNAASEGKRENLVIRISYDEGKTWSAGKVIDKGPSAYSEITVLEDGTIGVLYEPGYSSIRFVRFSLEALTDGEDSLTKPYEIR